MNCKIVVFADFGERIYESVDDFVLHYEFLLKSNCREFIVSFSPTSNKTFVYKVFSACSCMILLNSLTLYDSTISKMSKKIADILNKTF